MAAIIRNTKQDNALMEIEAALDTIKHINAILSRCGTTDTFQLSAVPERGRGVKVDVMEPEMKYIVSLCVKYRARLVKGVQSKAKKYRISLDEADLDCMRQAGEGPALEDMDLSAEAVPDLFPEAADDREQTDTQASLF